MKENDSSPPVFGYPHHESYFLTQPHHADILKDNNNDKDTVFRDSLLFHSEASAIKADVGVGPGAGLEARATQPGSITPAPSEPPSCHILRDKPKDQLCFSSSRSAVAAKVENNNGIGVIHEGGVLVVKKAGLTNDRSGGSRSNRPFQVSIPTDTEDSSSPTTSAKTSDPRAALHQHCQQQQEQEEQGHPTDAENNRVRLGYGHQQHQHWQPQHYYQGVDFVIQSRMNIERRQMHKSTSHRPPQFPGISETSEPDAAFKYKRQSRILNMSPIDNSRIDMGQSYISLRLMEDLASTRPGLTNQRNWSTSLSPLPYVLPFGATINFNRQAAQDQQSEDLRSEEKKEEERRVSSACLSNLLPDSSPGHQMHPGIEPGPLYGVRQPKFTHRHALYDVPFYGIESLEISSSRYEVLTQSNSIKELQVMSEPPRAKQESHGNRRSSGAGVGTGVCGQGGEVALLRGHREYIWSIAHEDEYGLNKTMGAGEGFEENGLLQGRHKRTQRRLPIAQLAPPAVNGSTSESVSGYAVQRQKVKGKNCYETAATERSGRREPDLRIEVDCSSQFELTNMETVSSLAALSSSTYDSNSTLLSTPDRRRNGNGHEHGARRRRSPPPSRLPRPVSQGVYGPDSFQDSFDQLNEIPKRPIGPIAKLLAIIRSHWKTWFCVGTLLAVAIMVPLMLKNGVFGGGKRIGFVGQGGVDDRDAFFNDEEMTPAKSSTGGVERNVVSKTVIPFTSSTHSMKVIPTSTTHSSILTALTLTPPSSTATHTSRATVRRSSITRIALGRRPKVFQPPL